MKRFLLMGLILTGAMAHPSMAQNTSSVFSPDVTQGKHAAEYRMAYDLEDEVWGHRIHYQYGITDSFRARAILSQRIESTDDWDFRYVRFEGLWQFLEDENAGWDSGLRFELQLADGDDQPSRGRIGWTGKVELDDYWEIRGNVLSGRQFGEDASDGFLLEFRAQVSREITPSLRLGVDYYADLNDTDDIGGFEEQEHQIGPVLKFKLGGGWKGQFGPLFGMSEAANDAEMRLFLIKEF